MALRQDGDGLAVLPGAADGVVALDGGSEIRLVGPGDVGPLAAILAADISIHHGQQIHNRIR